ncbi:MAG: hypothetical protein U9N35_06560, partial [Euryarchaeota archaeon]|nr:hypothetical protein [Euryarchaeota archaeon]
GAHTTSSAVRSYIYNAYDLFLLSDPTEIRIPLTFLKDPQENAFKDYEYLLRKTKKKGYEEMNVSESDLNDIEEHLINPNKYAFLKRNNSLVFLEASKSHWRNCYELMVWKGDKEEIMRMLEEFYGDRP